MAQKVFVKNDGSRVYEDTFQERPITIPPGGTITMFRREALQFLSMMSPTGKDGRPVEKKLRMIPIDTEIESAADEHKKKFVCNLDNKEFGTQKELDDHLKTLASKAVSREQIDAVVAKK